MTVAVIIIRQMNTSRDIAPIIVNKISNDPEKVAPIFSFATLAILSFLGGRISARLRGENGALCGLLFGLLMAAVMIALALAMSLAIDPLTYALAAAGAVGMAVLGGRGAQKKKPGKHRRKKR